MIGECCLQEHTPKHEFESLAADVATVRFGCVELWFTTSVSYRCPDSDHLQFLLSALRRNVEHTAAEPMEAACRPLAHTSVSVLDARLLGSRSC